MQQRRAAAEGRSIRWGIIGAGGIATDFCDDLQLLDDHEVVAVGARSAGTSDAFASRFGIPHTHASYADLVADPLVDVVYVATPHPMHHDAAMLAIEAGKAVLVEKPFTMDAAAGTRRSSRPRARAARSSWRRCGPASCRTSPLVRDVLASGRLGDLVLVTAEHGQWFAEDPEFRLFAPGLGGGALLDLGIYPVSFASMVLGTPTRITAVSDPAFTGVDAQTSVILRDDAGRHAVLTTTLGAATPNGAAISGTLARLEIDPTFYRPDLVHHRRPRRRARAGRGAARRQRPAPPGRRGRALPARRAHRVAVAHPRRDGRRSWRRWTRSAARSA